MANPAKQTAHAALRRLYRRLPAGLRARVGAFRRSHARPLHATLPLPLPETMHIDPANVCNFRCRFCPTADPELLRTVDRPKGIMEYDLFAKTIGELQSLVERHRARLALLHLYKDGEPLLNRRFADMAALAKRAGVAEVVSTTTNGSLLTEERALEILASGLDQLRVSVVQVSDEGYRDLTQTFGDYEKVKRNVGFLFAERRRRRSPLRIIAKTNDSGLSPEEKRRFAADFAPISDMLMVDSMIGWSLSEVKDFTLGIQVDTGMDGVSPLRDRRVCPEPFSRLAVNFDGQVSVCCVDWSYGTIVGDLRRETLGEVWNGEKLRQFRITHLTGRRETIAVCAHCQYVLGEPPDRDLDAQAERLLPVYRA
jgi:MoaA/NifB/PqqE/SkfB family radical SAM enzyme